MPMRLRHTPPIQMRRLAVNMLRRRLLITVILVPVLATPVTCGMPVLGPFGPTPALIRPVPVFVMPVPVPVLVTPVLVEPIFLFLLTWLIRLVWAVVLLIWLV